MMRGELWNNRKRVLQNEIQREQLKPGDHIYTRRRRANTNHHGIYINDGKVIHFNEWSDDTCPQCGVVYSCIDCFLAGGDHLYVFEYDVNPAIFLAKLWGTCTLASSDPSEVVQNRAYFLLDTGSADYYSYITNSEDFAIYCKTGLLVSDRIDFSRFLQTAFFMAITAFVFVDQQKQLMLSASFFGLLGRYVGIYCICRFAPDIRARPNVIKIEVERLPKVDVTLASGGKGFRVIQSYIDLFLRILMVGFWFCLLSSMRSEPHEVWSRTLKLTWTLACFSVFYWAILQRRLLPNRIQKEQLKDGDHIYTYRRAYTYAHHGIYVGDGMVIHLDRGEDPISSSGGQPTKYHVESCSIKCFLDGGELYLYKYGINLAFFIATTRGGTCTTCISTDSIKRVKSRANLLLKHKDYGVYNLFNNNCEDFAIYCKTGLLSTRIVLNHGKNGQIAYLLAICLAILFLRSLKIQTSNCTDIAATFYFIYSIFRLILDDTETGIANKVPVKKLADAFRSRHDMRRRMRICLGCCIFGGFLMIIYFSFKAVTLFLQKLF